MLPSKKGQSHRIPRDAAIIGGKETRLKFFCMRSKFSGKHFHCHHGFTSPIKTVLSLNPESQSVLNRLFLHVICLYRCFTNYPYHYYFIFCQCQCLTSDAFLLEIRSYVTSFFPGCKESTLKLNNVTLYTHFLLPLQLSC